MICRPFLELRPVSGSLVAHPPYCEELLEAALRHMERLLQESAEPLSFVVVLPEWPDRTTHALTKLQASHFKRKQVHLNTSPSKPLDINHLPVFIIQI